MRSHSRAFAATILVLWPLGNLALATVGFKPAQSYAVGTAPAAVAVADFNNDGKPDIAVAYFGGPSAGDDGGVSILLGNGDGTFQPATNVPGSKNPSRIATGDFNSDGRADLLVVRSGDNTNDFGGATIFLGNGDGTFSRGQTLAPGKNPVSVAVSDLNADHKLDLIFVNSTDDSATILMGNGDGTFQSAVAYAVEGSPFAVAVTDINQDGRSDLAVFWGISADFFLGNGDGTFQKGPTAIAGSLQVFTIIGDFNRDGKSDLIQGGCEFLHPKNCFASIRLGNGDATFQPGTPIPYIHEAVAADLDGDGKLDLVDTASDATQFTVFLGNGDGTFQKPLTFAAGTSPVIGYVADFNGDKAPDLVAVNSSTNAINVLLNTGTDFSISASPLSPTSVSPGQSATSQLTLNLLNAFDNPVSLACTVKPAQSGSPTCSLSSGSVTFDSGGKANATLTLTAGSAAAALAVPHFSRGDSHLLRFLWLPVAGFAFAGAGLGCKPWSTKRRRIFLAGTALFAGMILQSACGGESSRPAAVDYAVTVTATAGSTFHSTSLTLSVH